MRLMTLQIESGYHSNINRVGDKLRFGTSLPTNPFTVSDADARDILQPPG